MTPETIVLSLRYWSDVPILSGRCLIHNVKIMFHHDGQHCYPSPTDTCPARTFGGQVISRIAGNISEQGGLRVVLTAPSERVLTRGWLPRKDSNLDKEIQNLWCYRYTTRQAEVRGQN